MLSGFWAAVENVLFLLGFFLCLILAVYACGLSLSFLPCVFFFFLFPLTLLCLPTHVFVFCCFFSLLSQGLSRLFNTTTFIHFFSAAPDCYRLFLHFAVMFLLLYFFFFNFLETFAERFVPTHPPVTIHEGQVNAGGADSTPAPSSDGGRRGDGRWDTREVKLG